MPTTSFKNPIGLDISDFKIRFFQFHHKRKSQAKINSFGEIDVPPGYITDGEIKNETEVINLLKKLVGQPIFGKPDNKYVNAALPEKKIYLKTIEIPNVPDNEIKGAVSWGIEQNIPITLDQVYFDWHFISPGLKNEKKKLKVLVAVAPKNIVELYTDIIKKAELLPLGLESESVAVARCLLDQKSNIQHPLLILDLGRSKTNLIIYDDNAVQFTSILDVCGQEMTKAIAQNLKLSLKDAEKAKIICGLDQRKARGAIKKILEPIINRLIIKTKEDIDYYNNYLSAKRKINTVLLTGSVSKMVGLTRFLQQNLKCTTLLGDPWTNITPEKDKRKKYFQKNNFFPFTTAIGLALKKFD